MFEVTIRDVEGDGGEESEGQNPAPAGGPASCEPDRERASGSGGVPPVEEISTDQDRRHVLADDAEFDGWKGCLHLLSPKQRVFVLLHYRDRMTQVEIAEHLGISQSAVSTRKKNALKVRKQFERDQMKAQIELVRSQLN